MMAGMEISNGEGEVGVIGHCISLLTKILMKNTGYASATKKQPHQGLTIV